MKPMSFELRSPKHYSLNELQSLSTLVSGYTDDLKVDTTVYRVWLSRMTIEDGMRCNNLVTVERLDDRGRWVTFETYEAK